MSDQCQCGCHGAGGWGGSSDKPCCECKGVNFVQVPAMSSVEIETGIKKCMECHVMIEECKCPWSGIRQLQHRMDYFILSLHEWKDETKKSVKNKIDDIYDHLNSLEKWNETHLSKGLNRDDIIQGINVRVEDIAKKVKCLFETPMCIPLIFSEKAAHEAWQEECESKLNSLSFELLDLKEGLRFLHNQKNYDLPSLVTLNKQVQDHIEKLKDDGKSETIEKLKEKIEILMDCLNRKTMNIETLEQELKDHKESFKCETKNYEFRIKEMQQIIADRNKEIYDLRNPQNSHGNCCEH